MTNIPNFTWRHIIPDFDMTWWQLAAKYDPDAMWASHPVLTREMWQGSGSDRLYWKWLVTQLQALQEELAEDNPYN